MTRKTRSADCFICGFLALYYGKPDSRALPEYLCAKHKQESAATETFRELPALGLDYCDSYNPEF